MSALDHKRPLNIISGERLVPGLKQPLTATNGHKQTLTASRIGQSVVAHRGDASVAGIIAQILSHFPKQISLSAAWRGRLSGHQPTG